MLRRILERARGTIEPECSRPRTLMEFTTSANATQEAGRDQRCRRSETESCPTQEDRPAATPKARPTVRLHRRKVRPCHRRVAGQGEDDQQVPRPELPRAGQLRPRPRPAPPRKKKGEEVAGIDIANGWKLRYVVDERRRRGGRGDAAPHARQTSSPRSKREATKANRVPARQRPRPRGRGDRLAHRRRAEAARWPHVPHHVQRDHQDRRCRRRWPHPDKINMDRVCAQEARRGDGPRRGLPAVESAGQEGGRRAERRPGAVGRGQADRRPRARDRGVQDGGILEDHGAAREGRRGRGLGRATRRSPRSSRRRRREAAKPVEWHAPTDADAVPDSDEPVVDTEAEAPAAGEGGTASGAAAATEKGGLPTPPEKAFLAELVKWDGAEPKLSQRGGGRCRRRGAGGRAVRRLEGRAEGPAGPAAARRSRRARCSSRRTSGCGSARAARCRRPRSCTRASSLTGMGQTALITYMRTDSTRVSNDALERGARLHPGRHPARAEATCPRRRTCTPPARAPRRRTRRSARPT